MELELFNYIKDQLALGSDSDQVKIDCQICGKRGHFSNNCGDIHYKVDRLEYFVRQGKS
jgi:hypothetical protein